MPDQGGKVWRGSWGDFEHMKISNLPRSHICPNCFRRKKRQTLLGSRFWNTCFSNMPANTLLLPYQHVVGLPSTADPRVLWKKSTAVGLAHDVSTSHPGLNRWPRHRMSQSLWPWDSNELLTSVITSAELCLDFEKLKAWLPCYYNPGLCHLEGRTVCGWQWLTKTQFVRLRGFKCLFESVDLALWFCVHISAVW